MPQEQRRSEAMQPVMNFEINIGMNRLPSLTRKPAVAFR